MKRLIQALVVVSAVLATAMTARADGKITRVDMQAGGNGRPVCFTDPGKNIICNFDKSTREINFVADYQDMPADKSVTLSVDLQDDRGTPLKSKSEQVSGNGTFKATLTSSEVFEHYVQQLREEESALDQLLASDPSTSTSHSVQEDYVDRMVQIARQTSQIIRQLQRYNITDAIGHLAQADMQLQTVIATGPRIRSIGPASTPPATIIGQVRHATQSARTEIDTAHNSLISGSPGFLPPLAGTGTAQSMTAILKWNGNVNTSLLWSVGSDIATSTPEPTSLPTAMHGPTPIIMTRTPSGQPTTAPGQPTLTPLPTAADQPGQAAVPAMEPTATTVPALPPAEQVSQALPTPTDIIAQPVQAGPASLPSRTPFPTLPPDTTSRPAAVGQPPAVSQPASGGQPPSGVQPTLASQPASSGQAAPSAQTTANGPPSLAGQPAAASQPAVGAAPTGTVVALAAPKSGAPSPSAISGQASSPGKPTPTSTPAKLAGGVDLSRLTPQASGSEPARVAGQSGSSLPFGTLGLVAVAVALGAAALWMRRKV